MQLSQDRIALIGGWICVLVLSAASLYLFSFESRPVNIVVHLFTAIFPALIMAGHTYREYSPSESNHEFSTFAFLTGFLVAWVPWKIFDDMPFYTENPHLAYIGVGGILVLLVMTAFAQIYAGPHSKATVIT